MRTTKSISRIIGILLLVQLAGFIVPFVILQPIIMAGFLTSAAGNAFQVKTAVFLLFWNCAVTIAISIAGWPIFRQSSEAASLLLVAVSVMMFVLQAVDNIQLLSMLSLSQQYTQAGGQEELFQTLAAAIRSTRKWAHYSELLMIDAWICVFYSLLYRSVLVPRAVALLGLTTITLHFTGMTMPLFLGYRGVAVMAMSIILSHLTLAVWLVCKGFDDSSLLPGVKAHSPAISQSFS
ncbi:MAG TPA: DUF4386 domain-containing protein [Acidobacteriota bacterium]|nr:DUF4386 domain-containing protein [Acidobacteriota bacterium]